MLTEDVRNPYVDFKYYQDSYRGDVLTATSFDTAERDAEAYLHTITFGRVRNMEEIPDSVKKAICSMAEVVHRRIEEKSNTVSSESNDGYSVTYVTATKEEDYKKELLSKAKMWLNGTGLMYKGWSEKYDRQR